MYGAHIFSRNGEGIRTVEVEALFEERKLHYGKDVSKDTQKGNRQKERGVIINNDCFIEGINVLPSWLRVDTDHKRHRYDNGKNEKQWLEVGF